MYHDILNNGKNSKGGEYKPLYEVESLQLLGELLSHAHDEDLDSLDRFICYDNAATLVWLFHSLEIEIPSVLKNSFNELREYYNSLDNYDYDFDYELDMERMDRIRLVDSFFDCALDNSVNYKERCRYYHYASSLVILLETNGEDIPLHQKYLLAQLFTELYDMDEFE